MQTNPQRWQPTVGLTAWLSDVELASPSFSSPVIKGVLEKVRSAVPLATLGLLRALMGIREASRDFCHCHQNKRAHAGEGPPSQNNRLCLQNLALSLSESHLPLPAQTRTSALIYLRCDFPTRHLHSLSTHLLLPALKENQNRTF